MTRDYKELVERLHKRIALTYAGSPCQEDLIEAADAIKELLPSAQSETPPYVAEIESEYKKWVSMPHINKPLAKALYEVWKKHDREDVSRNG